MQLIYNAQNFGHHWGPLLTGTNQLSVTWEELIWSAITVGKPSLSHLFTYGKYSVSDIIARTHNVYANLCQTQNTISKSNLYSLLDPTEKGAISYFVGMLIAKLVAERLLNTPWLFHLSLFQASGGHVTLNSKSQPDLIGLNTRGEWVVIEAKGRTNAFSADVLAKAKSQTRKVRMVNGQFPVLRVGTHAYFAPNLRVAIEDPEEFDEEASDLETDEYSLFQNYYSFINSFTQDSNDIRDIGGRRIRFAPMNELGLTIGLDTNISEIIRGEDMSLLYEIPSRYRYDDTRHRIHDEIAIFSDGIAIGVDNRWGSENMKRQPKLRDHS